MPSVTFTAPDGSELTVEGFAGDSVMETAVRNGVPGIVAECGGNLACATCHVFVCPESQDAVDPMGDIEDDMLYGAAVDRQENSRLSCQLKLKDGVDLHVQTPETQI